MRGFNTRGNGLLPTWNRCTRLMLVEYHCLASNCGLGFRSLGFRVEGIGLEGEGIGLRL